MAQAAGQGVGRLADAHRALLADPDIQFRLTAAPPPPETPAWMRTLGEWITWALRPMIRAFHWLGSWLPDWPYARILLWSVIALAAAIVGWMVVERIRHGVWRLPRWRRRVRVAVETVADDQPLFEAAPARAWLREADALAALGRFAEAAHLLLLRSVEDLARRRPGAVRPALTARELAAAPIFPPAVRAPFAGIAALVERSLFGGRPVDAGEWTAARASYAELALPKAWR
jgi:hypothetical protein